MPRVVFEVSLLLQHSATAARLWWWNGFATTLLDSSSPHETALQQLRCSPPSPGTHLQLLLYPPHCCNRRSDRDHTDPSNNSSIRQCLQHRSAASQGSNLIPTFHRTPCVHGLWEATSQSLKSLISPFRHFVEHLERMVLGRQTQPSSTHLVPFINSSGTTASCTRQHHVHPDRGGAPRLPDGGGAYAAVVPMIARGDLPPIKSSPAHCLLLIVGLSFFCPLEHVLRQLLSLLADELIRNELLSPIEYLGVLRRKWLEPIQHLHFVFFISQFQICTPSSPSPRPRQHLEKGDLEQHRRRHALLVHFEAGFLQRYHLFGGFLLCFVDFAVRSLATFSSFSYSSATRPSSLLQRQYIVKSSRRPHRPHVNRRSTETSPHSKSHSRISSNSWWSLDLKCSTATFSASWI